MKQSKKITALAGGVGASKLLLGLYEVMNPANLTIIVNTGDDIVLHGLRISPDLDIVTYTLAGIVDPSRGWGYRGETFHALKRLADYGRPDWFNLGDRDLATHMHRTALLAEGKTLSQATDSIRIALGVKSRVLPMSDSPIPTIIDSNEGPIHFQEYLVKRRAEPVVKAIRFAGAESAFPAPGVLAAIREADRILICPSNPLISIGPILAVPQVRDELRAHKEKVFAVCPIVGGKSLKGPSDKMLAQLGHDPTALGVARLYADFTGTFIIDPADKFQSAAISALGMQVVVLPTVMKTRGQKRKLARALLSLPLSGRNAKRLAAANLDMLKTQHDAPWHRFRDAMGNSVRLIQRDKYREALKLLDESIAEAIQEREISWIRNLCHHAAVISKFMGNLQLEKQYYEQSLAFSAENPRALYGLAKIARQQGELETARGYAARCHKAILEGDDEIVKAGLLDLVLSNWPELGER